jgi:hypothetical protein
VLINLHQNNNYIGIGKFEEKECRIINHNKLTGNIFRNSGMIANTQFSIPKSLKKVEAAAILILLILLLLYSIDYVNIIETKIPIQAFSIVSFITSI